MQVLILTEHVELQIVQLLQVLTLLAPMFVHHLLVLSQELFGLACFQELLILYKLLVETVDESPTLGI